MEIIENYDLTPLNTFHVPAQARFFAEVKSEEELSSLFESKEFKENKKLFLGGGSNILLIEDFDGTVVLNKIKGVEILKEDDECVFLRSAAGEIWHDFVLFAVERGYWGIENLSFVPGTVGGAPMQNIGAYGAELKNVFENLEAYEIETGRKRIFENKECEFGYRDSIFKNELKGKYFITAITLKLSKLEKKNIEYRVLREYLEKNKIEVKSSKDVSDAVTSIRRSKLPDPSVLGNAGSFFKNVFLHKINDEGKLKELLKKYPDLPSFDEGERVKIPAAWLIEECGWKGRRVGNAGVHDKQALILVNYGGATGVEIKHLADEIIASVFSKFNLQLSLEVNLI